MEHLVVDHPSGGGRAGLDYRCVQRFVTPPSPGVVAFLSGTYLAVVGLAVLLLPTDDGVLTVVLEVALFGLAVLAIVGSLWAAVSSLVPESGHIGDSP